MLTQKRLREVLHYDPEDGAFTWVGNYSNAPAGAPAGGPSDRGYWHIMVDGKTYKAHRLAWLYVHGYFPEAGLDHRDRVKHHNWISNLREASQQCNMRNIATPKTNSSGVKGISWDAAKAKWVAQIGVSGNVRRVGAHEDFLEAVCHRLAAEQCLNWAGCDSSSPAYGYVKANIPTII